MNLRKPLFVLTGAGALLVAGPLFAQQAPMPSDTAPSHASSSATFKTPEGELTIHSTIPPVNPTQPPPFDQLSAGGKFISEEQATAYPLLANDFDYADKNRDRRISKREYERWSKQQ